MTRPVFGSEYITEADVMMNNLAGYTTNFTSGSLAQSIALRSGNIATVGALAMMHEQGHTLGLQHPNSFALMRAGFAAVVPFRGYYQSSPGPFFSGPEGTFGDDYAGLLHEFPLVPDPQNDAYTTSQLLVSSGIQDTNQNPSYTTRVPYPPTLNLCPGNNFLMYIGFGNHRSIAQLGANVTVTANAPPLAGFGSGGTVVDSFSVSMPWSSTFAVQRFIVIPTAIPRSVPLNIYTNILQTTDLIHPDNNSFDDNTVSATQIVVGSVSLCGI